MGESVAHQAMPVIRFPAGLRLALSRDSGD